MYTFESRVRFSEADHTELLTLPGLVNYFQDCSTFQSEDIGYGVESLKKSGQAWILSVIRNSGNISGCPPGQRILPDFSDFVILRWRMKQAR